MNTKQAVQFVLNTNPDLTKYALAKQLGMTSSTSVNQWLGNTRMSATVATKFEALFDIKISNAYEAL